MRGSHRQSQDNDAEADRRASEILAAVLKSPDVFESVDHAHRGPFISRAAPILQFDYSEAEDVVQETFLKMYRYAAMFIASDEQRFHSWAYTILLNTAYTHRRRIQRWWRYALWNDENEGDILTRAQAKKTWERFVMQAEAKQQVRLLFERIPNDMRVMLRWFYLEGLSLDQISSFTGLTVGAIKMRLMRARRYCRALLVED